MSPKSLSPFKPAFVLFVALLCAAYFSQSYAQAPDTNWVQMVKKAEQYQMNKRYDSGLILCTRCIKVGQEKGYRQLPIYTALLYVAGACYEGKDNLQEAHSCYSQAIANGRKYQHDREEGIAFVAINNLYARIVKDNRRFKYPDPGPTIEAGIYFSIDTAVVVGDSIEITVRGGSLDGIRMSALVGTIYARTPSAREGTNRIGGVFLGRALIRQVMENRTILRKVKADSIPRPGDVVRIFAVIPASWNSSPFKTSLANNICWETNWNKKIYDRRFLYYYYDSAVNKEIYSVFKSNIREVLDRFAADTLEGGTLGTVMKNGIFTNLNLYKALDYSSERIYRYFQNYALEYQSSYRGNDFRFSEAFASWVIEGAPLLSADVKDHLLSINRYTQKQYHARLLKEQIVKENLTRNWFDEGMELVLLDDIKQARALGRILYDYGIGTNSPPEKGWACYLEAVCLERLQDHHLTDSLLNAAEQYFITSNDGEGLMWVENGRQFFKTKPTVSFAVQTGHLMPFTIAMSPNSRYFATGSDDKLIKIWDIYNAKEVRTIAGHTASVDDITYSPGGRYLASISSDSTIKIWNGYDYSLMRTIKEKLDDGKIIFSPDSKKLVSIGADSGIRVWDIFSGKLIATLYGHRRRIGDITFHPTKPELLVSCGRDSLICFWNIDSLAKVDSIKTKGRIVRGRFSNNGRVFFTTFTDTTLIVWVTDPYQVLQTQKIKAGVVGNSIFLSNPCFSPDSKYLLYIDSSNKRVIEELETSYYRSDEISDKDGYLQEQIFNRDGSFLIEKYGSLGELKIIDFSDYSFAGGFATHNTSSIKKYSNPVVNVSFGENDSALFVQTMAIEKVDLTNGTTLHLSYGLQAYDNASFVTESGPFITYLSNTYDTLLVKNYRTGEVVNRFSTPNKRKIKAIRFTGNNAICYLGTADGFVTAWNTADHKMLFSKYYASSADSNISWVYYDSLYDRLFIITRGSSVLVADPLTGDVKDSLQAAKAWSMAFSKEKTYVLNDKAVYVYDANTLKLVKTFAPGEGVSDAGTLLYSYQYKRLVVAGTNGDFYVLDAATGNVLYHRPVTNDNIAVMALNKENSLIAAACFDNKVSLFNFQTGEHVLTLHTPADEDVVLSDTLGHYMAPKSSLQGIVFNYNNNSYNFEQFDLQYNRPDLILSKTGKADTSLIQSYNQAYKKRLKRAGITEQEMSVGLNLPVIRIPGKLKIRPVTSSPAYEFSVECYDARYKLQAIHVLVNNSPVYGTTGMDVTALDTFQIKRKVTVPLSKGNNSIRIYCTNEKGVASFKETFEVYSNYSVKEDLKTYFVGIAVANYKDSLMNLRYSAKDVRDLARSFKKIYPNAVIDTLIDRQATKENILMLKQRLMKTTVNDNVVMAVTGHGLLSDSLDFYYGTYDVDFKKPIDRGLKYEDLENLLSDIPARQKILMIDACHSGALDKETLLEATVIQKGAGTDDNGKVTATSRSSIRIKPAKVSLNNTYELMQNLFADLSSSNGTVVISAAGGLEYAFESPAWNNGVFTYCVRRGIEEKEADKEGNNDGQVSVQELSKYVSKKVSQLTNGRQRPTSRRENIEYDWIIRPY